jgi:hypothetical protein
VKSFRQVERSGLPKRFRLARWHFRQRRFAQPPLLCSYGLAAERSGGATSARAVRLQKTMQHMATDDREQFALTPQVERGFRDVPGDIQGGKYA